MFDTLYLVKVKKVLIEKILKLYMILVNENQ